MKELTINDLKVLVDKAIKDGHGDKVINLSNDDEGNGFHKMYYAITPVTESEAESFGLDPDKDIIVG